MRITARRLAAVLLVASLIGLPGPTGRAMESEKGPPLRGPADHQPPALGPSSLNDIDLPEQGLRAVAIVGDAGALTEGYRADMAQAVQVLREDGVTVEEFYYGEHGFGWGDVVSAAVGASFLLYMGHGVYWSDSCIEPELVGGFYLGNGFVHPDDIRRDLSDQLATGAVVVLSHACFAAGATSCDEPIPDWPTEDEAARRVGMYAAPFTDIGVQAYFANNYYTSAAETVGHLLTSDPVPASEAFESVHPYDPDSFRDLEHPHAPCKSLWLSGETGYWHHAFVGIPDYVFGEERVPRLGPLPISLTFTYFLSDTVLLPSVHAVVPENVGSYDSFSWEVTWSGDWLTVSPTSGETCSWAPLADDGFAITTVQSDWEVGAQHTGAITLTVIDPDGTEDGVQAVSVILRAVSGSPTRIYVPLLVRR